MIGLHLISLLGGFLLDALVGDPHWMPHPVRWMGRLIAWLERWIRPRFSASPRGEQLAGGVEVLLVLLICGGLTAGVLAVCYHIAKGLYVAVSIILSAYMLAGHSLRLESMKVALALEAGDLEGGAGPCP